jgi:hypothetical protein
MPRGHETGPERADTGEREVYESAPVPEDPSSRADRDDLNRHPRTPSPSFDGGTRSGNLPVKEIPGRHPAELDEAAKRALAQARQRTNELERRLKVSLD